MSLFGSAPISWRTASIRAHQAGKKLRGCCSIFLRAIRLRRSGLRNSSSVFSVRLCFARRVAYRRGMRVLRWLMLFALLAQIAWAGGVTWTDRGASQIKRMNFDGTALVTVPISGAISSPGTNIRGIALDLAGGRMFWADNGADRILRAQLNGTAATILSSLPSGFPADVRVDAAGQRLYFCDQQRSLIQRVSFDGSGLTTVIGSTNGNQPYFLELDFAAGKLYWGGFASGSIYRANLDGTGVETIITGNNNVRGVCL